MIYLGNSFDACEHNEKLCRVMFGQCSVFLVSEDEEVSVSEEERAGTVKKFFYVQKGIF